MRQPKILIVEDKVIAQRVARNILTDLGCAVEVANDGYTALDMVVNNGEYDLIFMDIGLPDIDGITLSQRIKSLFEKQVIVALTAHNDPAFRLQCAEVGMVDYLLKPVTSDSCKKILSKLNLLNDRVRKEEMSDDEILEIVDDTKLHYSSPAYDPSLYDRIFHGHAYHSDIKNPEPFIIDAGSHIGISTLYFKKQYPQSQILCFEPDPNNFKLLEKNIRENKVENVRLINAALSDKTGTIPFYGQIYSHAPISVANSIHKEWASQRLKNDECEVPSVQLSNYIDKPVDLLKLDIEGAEQTVIAELGDKLDLINMIILEYHEIEAIRSKNNLQDILKILHAHHFTTSVVEKVVDDRFPSDARVWVEQNQPHLFIVRAEKS